MPATRQTHPSHITRHSTRVSSKPAVSYGESGKRDCLVERSLKSHPHGARPSPEDPVKRPPNSFFCYRSWWFAQRADGRLNQQDVSKGAASMWNALTSEEKRPFEMEARLRAAQHKIDYPDYVFSPKKRDGKGKKSSPKATRARAAQAPRMSPESSSASGSSYTEPMAPVGSSYADVSADFSYMSGAPQAQGGHSPGSSVSDWVEGLHEDDEMYPYNWEVHPPQSDPYLFDHLQGPGQTGESFWREAHGSYDHFEGPTYARPAAAYPDPRHEWTEYEAPQYY